MSTPTEHPSRAQIDLLYEYVADHAADHDDDCPEDDTCECSYKARNDAVNACCRFLRERRAYTPAPPSAPAPDCPECKQKHHHCQCAAEPPETAIPLSMSEIQVGDWVLVKQGAHWPVLAPTLKNDDWTLPQFTILEVRGERNGQPFIWRRPVPGER